MEERTIITVRRCTMGKKYTKSDRNVFETRVWDGTYNPDGSKHRQRIYSRKSSSDLERLVAEFKKKVEEGSLVMEQSPDFFEYALRWLEIEKASCEKNTQKMYQSTVNCFEILKGVPVNQIKHSHLQQVINTNMHHPKTCKNIKYTFSQILRAAIRDRLISRDSLAEIMEDVSLPHYAKPQKRPLTAVEKEAVANVKLDPRKDAFLSILYYCGLRRQEALALTPACFDWEKKTLSVSKVLVFDSNASEIKDYPKSDHGFRTIPMTEDLITRIRPFVEGCEDEYLFRTQCGALMTQIGYRRMWDSIVTALNVAAGYNPNAKKNRGEKPITGLTAHIFRHNFCTELCYQIPAISTKMIAKLLGDDERMVLDVYSHILAERENVAETLNKAFSKS